MKTEYYFRLKLTENEHYIIEDSIKDFCNKNDLQLVYYRKMKNGHIPMVRECKITGPNIGRFIQYIKDIRLDLHMIPNE